MATPLMETTPSEVATRPPRARPALLRMGTHNVNGRLGSKSQAGRGAVYSMIQLWCQLQLAVICVQETHVHSLASAARAQEQIDSAAGQMVHPGWLAYWGLGASAQSAGVAILVRRDLLADGSVRVRELAAGHPHLPVGARGRLIHLRLDWGGHKLRVACVYLPSGEPAGQREFINTHLHALKQLPGQHVWAGDFNFTMEPCRDRLQRFHPSSTNSSTRVPADTLQRSAALAPGSHPEAQPSMPHHASHSHPDVRTAAAFWAATRGSMEDTFRVKHPRSNAFTYIHPCWASRIDRFHNDTDLRTFITACDVQCTGSMVDHRPVTLHLVARADTTSAVGKGLRRTRLHFHAVPQLREEMDTWLALERAAAPISDDAALLIWWPAFKTRLAAKAAQLNATARAARVTLSAAAAASNLQMGVAMAAVDNGYTEGLPTAVAARQAFAAASTAACGALDLQRRHAWLHVNERPAPHITKMLRPPQEARFIAGLRHPSGELETRPQQLAQLVADFWADVSKPPVNIEPAAQAEVLGALRADTARRIDSRSAATLGEAVVSAEEVMAALATAATGHSPGPDGLPYEMYSKFSAHLVPLLTSLFSAVGRQRLKPRSFLDGAISTLFKDKGERDLPANYRPLTLLGCDYRLLAKVLANRLGPCLAEAIGLEQSAFLKDRGIGQNIMLLQMLPQLLKLQNRSAAIAFCDFAKAYDTIDRGFLLAAMDAMGAGEGFISWVDTLLTDTRAVAIVNGHVSKAVSFKAGVRQGCPLAPLLYLFIAQALQSWLQYRGIGINIAADGEPHQDIAAPHRITAPQFADDTEVLLPSIQQCVVHDFLDAMGSFARASGQHLNTNKTVVMPIGQHVAGAVLPVEVEGLTIVTHADALGITFTNGGTVPLAAGPARHRTSRRSNALPQLTHRPAPTIDELTATAAATALTAAQQAGRLANGHATRAAVRHAEAATSQATIAEAALAALLVPPPMVPTILPRLGPCTPYSSPLLPAWVVEEVLGGAVLPETMPAPRIPMPRILSPTPLGGTAPAPSVLPSLPTPPWPPLPIPPADMAAHHVLPPPPPIQLLPPPAARATAAIAAALPQVNWEKKLAGARGVCRMIPPLQLSTFGRAFAVSAYANSSYMFAAEFAGMPPANLLLEIEQLTKKLVDRNQGPDDVKRKICGVASELLPGKPKDGGFGLLPSVLNINSRHAVWGRQFLTSTTASPQPWLKIAHRLFKLHHPNISPLAMLVAPGGNIIASGTARAMPGAMQRMLCGLLALPRARDIGSGSLIPGPWCAWAPLWGNPLLSPSLMGDEFKRQRAWPAFATFRDLIGKWFQLWGEVANATAMQLISIRERQHMVRAVACALPVPWLLAAMRAGMTLGSEEEALDAMLPHIGWVSLAGPIPLTSLTVKYGTELQMAGTEEARHAAHAAFITEACGMPAGSYPGDAAIAGFKSLLQRCWKLKWENKEKEALWRLAVNGIPDGHRWEGRISEQPCGCGNSPAGRQHHFWECRVAQAVVLELQAAIGPQQAPLMQRQLWLMDPVPAGVHRSVWEVVCLAALSAIEHGRRQLMRLKLHGSGEEDPDYRQGDSQRPRAGSGRAGSQAERAEKAASYAIVDFWGRLENFVAVGFLPVGFMGEGTTHPFFKVGTNGKLTTQRLT